MGCIEYKGSVESALEVAVSAALDIQSSMKASDQVVQWKTVVPLTRYIISSHPRKNTCSEAQLFHQQATFSLSA